MDSDLAASLRSALTSGKAEDHEQFIRLSQPIIASAIIRTVSRWKRPDRNRVDDLVQETFAKMYGNGAQALKNVRSGESPALAAWLRTVAASVALDSLRSESSQKHGSGHVPYSLETPGLNLPAADNTFAIVERSLLESRINRCLESEKERDRSIFWLYYSQGFTARDIAAIDVIGIGTKGVEATILRITRAVRNCLGNSTLGRKAAGEGS